MGDFQIGDLVECKSVLSRGAPRLGERFIITSIEKSYDNIIWLGFKFDRYNDNETEKELIKLGMYPFWNSINFKIIAKLSKATEVLYGNE